MKYICLSSDKVHELPFYLSMEEYVARYIDEDSAFFMWQVEPTVIFGRNQLIDNEVNLKYCQQKGIHTYRRKSGGGCVYADMSNIMFSYITKDENVRFTFDSYLNIVVDMLHTLGVNATNTGRNDILIDGKKVSGNAFYHIPGRSIVHGTMLYDTDMTNMLQAITPSTEKLSTKGVDSVRQHITTLKQYIDLDINDFKSYVKSHLCDGEIHLDEHAITVIKEIEKEYLKPDFIYGKNPPYGLSFHRRVEGVGEFDVQLLLKNGIIKKINLMGDYFLIGDIENEVFNKLQNVAYNESAIRLALKNVDLEQMILNLNIDKFLKIII